LGVVAARGFTIDLALISSAIPRRSSSFSIYLPPPPMAGSE
jgi:hypothetical protein